MKFDFYYKKEFTDKQVVDEFDKDLPLKLTSIQHIIHRVHLRYPQLTKSEISLITLNFFKAIREILLCKKTLFLKDFFNMRLGVAYFKTRTVPRQVIKVCFLSRYRDK